MDYLARGGEYFQMKMVSCIWIAGTQLDEASASWINKPGSPAHGHLSLQALEQIHSSSINEELPSVLYPRADYSVVLSSQKLSLVLCCQHNKV